MLVNYTAKKGIKLYGDESFCLYPPEVLSPRNLLLNGDLKYGLYGWSGLTSTSLSIENGLLKILGAAGTYARQLVQVTSGKAYYYRATSVVGNTTTMQIRVLDGTTMAVLYDSQYALVDDVYGSWFTATSNSIYFELKMPVGYVSTDYLYFKDMMLAEFQAIGARAINLVSNSYFPDTVGWTAENGATLLASGGNLDITNGTATQGSAYTIIQVTAGLVYKLHYHFSFVFGTNVNVGVGTAATRSLYGGSATTISASRNGYVYFSPTVSGDCYITLTNLSTTLGHISSWGRVTTVQSNATIVDNEFRLSTSQWVLTGGWALNGLGQATITGGTGSTLTQNLTPFYVIGERYTIYFKLTIPSESILVDIYDTTSVVSASYTVSGYYSLSFTARATLTKLKFTSQATAAALAVELVTGGLSVPDAVNPEGGSLVGGAMGSAVSESNTGTPCVLSTGIYASPTYQDIESGLLSPVLGRQQVGTGDFTYYGWLYSGHGGSSNVFYLKKGDFADGQILGYLDLNGYMNFAISDNGAVSNDYVVTSASVSNRWVFWELVRSGANVFIRINGNAASPVVVLSQAVTSLDTVNGFNYIGSFNDYTVTFLTIASHVRFVPSAVTLQRSRATYASEKDMFKRDERYSVVDSLVELLVDSPTNINSKTTMVGTTIIPDSGRYQETTVNRMDELLQAASKELDYFELIEFKAFLTAVVQGGLFTYDAYAVSPENYINNLEVFLVGNSVSPTRQGNLERFIVSWSMRKRGGY